MKKFFVSLIIIPVILTSTMLVFSNEKYTLKDTELQAIDKVYEVLKIDNKTEKAKKNLMSWLEMTLSKFELYWKNYEIISALISKINSSIDDNTIPIVIENIQDSTTEENMDKSEDEKNIVWWDMSNDEGNPYRINLSKVKETWIWRQNEVRTPIGLSNYSSSSKLEKTAEEWAEILANRGDLDVMSVHKRDLSDSYYDYNKISNWMKDRGAVCKNINKYTFSESVAWTSYYCSESATDCTYELFDGMRKSFDRYMGERERDENSRPHYNAIISPNFKTQWLWITIKEKSPTHFEVFITTHYCTELED